MKNLFRVLIVLFIALAGGLAAGAPFVNPDIQSPVLQRIVATLSNLQALPITSAITNIYLEGRTAAGDGGQGVFAWDASDLSTEVAADILHGVYVPPNSDATGASGAWVRILPQNGVFVDWFGAKADGSTDSTAAINAADLFVEGSNRPLIFSPGIYRVDALTATAQPSMWIGNNTTIKCNGTGDNNQSMIKFGDVPDITLKGIIFDGNMAAAKVVIIEDKTGVGKKVLVENCSFINGLQTNVANLGLAAGLEVAGNYDVVRVTDSNFENIDSTKQSSPVARGLIVTQNAPYYVKNTYVDRCYFYDVTPVANGDCLFVSALNNSLTSESAVVTNSTFKDCSKRAVKSQIHNITVSNNKFERTQNFGGSSTSEVAAQYGGGAIYGNKIYYADGAYAPRSIFSVGTAGMNFDNPSIVDRNYVYVGNTTAIDQFVALNQANLALTLGTKITNNIIFGTANNFAFFFPDGRASEEVTFDQILIQGNYVKDISGTNAAFIGINRSGPGAEYAAVKARVIDNTVDSSADVDAMYTPDANTSLISLEWARNFHILWPTSYVYGLPNNDAEIQRKIEWTNGATTPSVQVDRENVFFQTNNGALTEYTNFLGAHVGQVIIIRVADANSRFKLSTGNFLTDGEAADIDAGNGDVLTFLYHSSEKWVLISHLDISTY